MLQLTKQLKMSTYLLIKAKTWSVNGIRSNAKARLKVCKLTFQFAFGWFDG